MSEQTHAEQTDVFDPLGDARRASPLGGLLTTLIAEVERQDAKHGPFEGTRLGRSRLAIACLEDEIEEARNAWRAERKHEAWPATRDEVLQVAAVAIRALRDAL